MLLLNALTGVFAGNSVADAVLNAYLFRNLAQIQEVVANGMKDYNTKYPHKALSYITPIGVKQERVEFIQNLII